METKYRFLPLPLVVGIIFLLLQTAHHSLTYTREIDFRYFAEQAADWAAVFRWSPFQNFAYPLLLRLGESAGFPAFTAARWLAPASLAFFLVAAWLAAREFLPPGQAFLAQALVAVNWHVAQFGLIAGPDLLWAAWQCLALTVAVRALRDDRPELFLAAGLLAGISFDFRSTGLVAVVPLSAAAIWSGLRARAGIRQALPLAVLLLGMAAAGLPQFWINQTWKGSPFAQGQAENVWFGMHGQGNWNANWRPGRAEESLAAVVRAEPGLFVRHWIREGVKCAGRLPLLAAGLQPIFPLQQFGAAGSIVTVALYALAGLALGAAIIRGRPERDIRLPAPHHLVWSLYLVVYCAAISMAFSTFRFLIVFVPWLAALAVGLLKNPRVPRGAGRAALALLFAAMLAHSTFGLRVILRDLQVDSGPVEQALRQSGAAAGDAVISTAPNLFAVGSAFHWLQLPVSAQTLPQLEEFARRNGSRHFLMLEPNTRGGETGGWPELQRALIDHPLGPALYRRDRYLRAALIDLAPKGE